MKKTNLVMLLKVSGEQVRAAALSKRLDELRGSIYSKVSDFIAPFHGTGFVSSLPANEAWGQKTYEPNGVIFGATEPAQFMYFFSNAVSKQEERLGLAIYETLRREGERISDGQSNGTGISAYAVNSSLFAGDPWIGRFASGEFLHDCGLYSLVHQTGNLDDDKTDEVKKNMRDYAICVLDVYE